MARGGCPKCLFCRNCCYYLFWDFIKKTKCLPEILPLCDGATRLSYADSGKYASQHVGERMVFLSRRLAQLFYCQPLSYGLPLLFWLGGWSVSYVGGYGD